MKKTALLVAFASASFALAGCQQETAEAANPETEVVAETPVEVLEAPAAAPEAVTDAAAEVAPETAEEAPVEGSDAM